MKEIKAMKNEMAAENGNRRPSPTFSASFSSSPTNPMLQFNNSPNVISPKPTSTGTPASSPKVGDHTVNFKRAKVAKVLAPCGGLIFFFFFLPLITVKMAFIMTSI